MLLQQQQPQTRRRLRSNNNGGSGGCELPGAARVGGRRRPQLEIDKCSAAVSSGLSGVLACTVLGDDDSSSCDGEDCSAAGSVDRLLRKINCHLAAEENTDTTRPSAEATEVKKLSAVKMRSRRTSAGDYHRNGYSGTPDFENGVIVKQRKELQLLVSELRERDTELNELVNSHQKQLTNWEGDRKRLIVLEEKLRQKDQDLQEKGNQLKSTMTRLDDALKQSEERAVQIQELQKSQDKLQDEAVHLRGACEELEDTNYQLDRRLRETSSQLVQVETRAAQLEQDVHTAAQNLHQLLHRLKASDATRAELQRQSEEQRRDNEQLRGEIRKLAGESRDLLRVNERQQQQLEQLQKDLQLAAERERRKDEMAQSQRLKQERTDAELQQLRGMYERMQMDLAALTSSLDTGRDLEGPPRAAGVDFLSNGAAGKPPLPYAGGGSSSSRPPPPYHHQPPSSLPGKLQRRPPPPSQLQPPPPHQLSGGKLGRGNGGGSLPDLSPGQEDADRWAAASKRLAGRDASAGRVSSSYQNHAAEKMLYSKELRDLVADMPMA